MIIGRKCLLHVSEKYTEEARLIEFREGGLALVEWRGLFCEVVGRRVVLPKTNSITTN